MISIFNYTNYRLFMRDYYLCEKKKNPHFSYRYIAQRVGFSSPGLFNQLINGKTKLSNHLMVKFSKFFKLKKRETEYFQLLVSFEKAKTNQEKKYFFDKIMNHKEIKKRILTPEQFVIYKKWYYTVVRNLLRHYKFKGDFKKLANMLRPSITEFEAIEAVNVLLKLQLVEINKDGFYEAINQHISLGKLSGTAPASIINSITGVLDIAKDSIQSSPVEERMLKAYCLAIPRQVYDMICNDIKEFYNELYRKERSYIQNSDGEDNKVYYLTTQLFPVSKRIPKK